MRVRTTITTPAAGTESASGEDVPDWQRSPALTSTFRLSLRKFTPHDARDYFQIFSNPNICKFDDFEPISLDKARSDVGRIVANYGAANYMVDGSENEYAVELKNRRKVIGVLCARQEEGALYVGYHFNEKFHGKGYALEAMTAFIFWLHKNTGREILAVTDTRNERSINLLLNMGFEFVQTISKMADGEQVNEFLYRYVGALRLS
ncbi:MAG TPA: GNAT family N-acetyltransferase [Gammaproteobacteria bacterium]|nr:GNAT family N-acetyltransferase [Gammaproteobacteria bacterium]